MLTFLYLKDVTDSLYYLLYAFTALFDNILDSRMGMGYFG
jgi:hypothetical protein